MLALPGERLERSGTVFGEVVERLGLSLEQRQELVRLAQRRVAAHDDLLEVFAAGREADAELVQDQSEPVRVGLAHDVVDQVEVDCLAVVLDREEALALAGLALLDYLQLRRRIGARRARLGRLALDELLAEERLRANQAGGVLAPVLKARVGDPHHDDRLAGLVRAVGVNAPRRRG